MTIPEQLTVDITDLHLHQAFKVEDLEEIEASKYTTDPNVSLVLIQAPSIEEEEVVEEELEEGEIMAEGEEPEVIKKEKDEEASAKGAEKKE